MAEVDAIPRIASNSSPHLVHTAISPPSAPIANRVARAPQDLLRRWVIPADRPSTGQPQTGEGPDSGAWPVLAREPGPDDPTLADLILDLDHHLPV